MPWSGLRTFVLLTQKLSVSSTALSQVSSITYLPKRDALVLTLADGSFHAIREFSTDPRLVSGPTDDGLSSDSLSKTARSVFLKVEEDEMTKMDVNAIHGMTSYDGDAFYTWIHESVFMSMNLQRVRY